MGAAFSSPSDEHAESLRRDPSLQSNQFPSTSGETLLLQGGEGRRLGYAVYGAPSAPPARTILFMHGTPGTRLFFTHAHDAYAARHAVRVVVPERPGYGLSTPARARSLASTVAEMVQLLDHLALHRVHCVGYSAGGPFAIAFAAAAPARCASLSVVSSLSPPGAGVTRGMTALSKFGYLLSRRTPALLRSLVALMSRVAVANVFAPARDDFTAEENRRFRADADLRACFARSTLELYSRPGGARAEADDYCLMAAVDWGFSLEVPDHIPVRLYGGGADDKCTPAMFQELKRQLPDRTTSLLTKGATHLYFYDLFIESLFQDIGLL